MTLYLISGHGAGDPGAGGNGYNEADMTREISSRLKALGGSQVVELDKTIDWYRAGRVNRDLKNLVGNNPVLEIHLDSAGPDARGGHVIIKEGFKADSYDVNLAEFLKSFFPGRSNVIVARSNLANVNRAAANDINYRLMECCFISNSEDMQKLVSQMDDFCRGVLGAFNIEGGSQPTPQPTPQPEPTPNPAPKPEQEANRDEWVASLQSECNAQGFSNQVVDGIAGPNTLRGCPTLRIGARGNITKLMQRRLIALGYSCGAAGADGVFGNGTQNAVKTYQSAHGLVSDGIVGRNTWASLLGL